MATEGNTSSLTLDLRAALVIGLAAALTHATCEGVGLSGSSLAYGSLIAALVVRPDFSRWPLLIYPVLLVLVGLCMAIGVSLGLALSNVPQVFVFGLVAALMQLITLALPSKLRLLSGAVACAGVLPLLGTPSWYSWRDEMLAIALGLRSSCSRQRSCATLQQTHTPLLQPMDHQPSNQPWGSASPPACAHPFSGESWSSPAWP